MTQGVTFRIPEFCATCEKRVHWTNQWGRIVNEAKVSCYQGIAQLYATGCGHVLAAKDLRLAGRDLT